MIYLKVTAFLAPARMKTNVFHYTAAVQIVASKRLHGLNKEMIQRVDYIHGRLCMSAKHMLLQSERNALQTVFHKGPFRGMTKASSPSGR